MTDPPDLLTALILFQIKHFAFDFLLQPAYIWRNKGTYGHPGGILHALGHMIGSVPALLVLTASLPVILVILLIEGMLHYHIDWCKEQMATRWNLSFQDPRYWYLFGFDQLLHHLTYVGMIWYFLA